MKLKRKWNDGWAAGDSIGAFEPHETIGLKCAEFLRDALVPDVLSFDLRKFTFEHPVDAFGQHRMCQLGSLVNLIPDWLQHFGERRVDDSEGRRRSFRDIDFFDQAER